MDRLTCKRSVVLRKHCQGKLQHWSKKGGKSPLLTIIFNHGCLFYSNTGKKIVYIPATVFRVPVSNPVFLFECEITALFILLVFNLVINTLKRIKILWSKGIDFIFDFIDHNNRLPKRFDFWSCWVGDVLMLKNKQTRKLLRDTIPGSLVGNRGNRADLDKGKILEI